jgi:hypothetical protein
MTPIEIKGHTRRLGAPSDWDHETQGICHTLEIVDHEGWMCSAWSLTEPERKRLVAGAPLILQIRGVDHPVVGLLIGDAP